MEPSPTRLAAINLRVVIPETSQEILPSPAFHDLSMRMPPSMKQVIAAYQSILAPDIWQRLATEAHDPCKLPGNANTQVTLTDSIGTLATNVESTSSARLCRNLPVQVWLWLDWASPCIDGNVNLLDKCLRRLWVIVMIGSAPA